MPAIVRVLIKPPQAWNRLPTELNTLRSTPLLERDLKTFLFGLPTMFNSINLF